MGIFYNGAPHAHLPASGLAVSGAVKVEHVLMLLTTGTGTGNGTSSSMPLAPSAGVSCITPLLRLLGNLSAMQAECVRAMSDLSLPSARAFLTLLHQLLGGIGTLCFSSSEQMTFTGGGSVRQLFYYLKDLLWLLGNILGILAQTGRAEICGLVEGLLQLLCVCTEYSVQKELVLALNNALLVQLPQNLGPPTDSSSGGCSVAALVMADRYRPALVELRNLLSTPRTTDTGLLIVLTKVFYKLATCSTAGIDTTSAAGGPQPQDMEWLQLICVDLGVLEFIENLSYLEGGGSALCDTATACVDKLYEYLDVLEIDDDTGGYQSQDQGGYYGPASSGGAQGGAEPTSYSFGIPETVGAATNVFDFSK